MIVFVNHCALQRKATEYFQATNKYVGAARLIMGSVAFHLLIHGVDSIGDVAGSSLSFDEL